MELIKKYWGLLLIGIVLRVFIAFFTYHPDVKILDFTTAEIFRNFNLNPYEQTGNIKSFEEPDDLPLQYFIHLPIDLLTRPLIDTKIEDKFLISTESLLGDFRLNLLLLTIKLPLILFDILLAIILALCLPQVLQKKGLLFWLFNPVTLWATSGIGQVDILPTFFMVLAFYFLQREKKELSALSLGVGAALKSFPFLIAPFLIFLGKNVKEKIILGVLVVMPYLLSIIPFLGSHSFRQKALFAPQMDKIFYAKIDVSGGEAIFINVAILGFLYLVYFLKKRESSDFVKFSAITLMLILAFTHFHMQWFSWVTPFLIYLILKGFDLSQKLSVFGLGISFLLMLFLFEGSLQVRLFAPLFPGLATANGLAEILKNEQLVFLKSIAASIFAASAIYLSFRIYNER